MSRSSTSRAGSVMTEPSTVTRPSKMIVSEPRREATPAWARYLARRIEWPATIGGVDLELLERTLAEAGEPAFRARQVWRWAANGAHGYEEMTDLPAALRAQLASEVPFSTLELLREANAADGAVKTMF